MQDSFDACFVACKFEHDVASATRRVGSWLELVGELWTDVYSESRAFFAGSKHCWFVPGWSHTIWSFLEGERCVRRFGRDAIEAGDMFGHHRYRG